MNKQQIKSILDNAPERSTHVAMTIKLPNDLPTPVYVRHMNADTWLRFNPNSNNYGKMKKSGINFLKTIRKLDDLRTQLALIEENEKLKELITKVKQDLLMRAETDSEGFKVVDLSSSIWEQVKELSND